MMTMMMKIKWFLPVLKLWVLLASIRHQITLAHHLLMIIVMMIVMMVMMMINYDGFIIKVGNVRENQSII